MDEEVIMSHSSQGVFNFAHIAAEDDTLVERLASQVPKHVHLLIINIWS